MLMATGKNLIVGRGNDWTSAAYGIASKSDLTTWKAFPGPETGAPIGAGALGGIPEFVAYDSVHHVLYVSTNGTGLWQTVIE